MKLTKHFAISVPQKPTTNASELQKFDQSPDIGGLKTAKYITILLFLIGRKCYKEISLFFLPALFNLCNLSLSLSLSQGNGGRAVRGHCRAGVLLRGRRLSLHPTDPRERQSLPPERSCAQRPQGETRILKEEEKKTISRPTFSQFWSFKIRGRTFLIFPDRPFHN